MNDRYSGYSADSPDDDEFGDLDLDLEEVVDLDGDSEFEELDEYEFEDEYDLDDE